MDVNITEPGKYKVEALIKANETCKLNVKTGYNTIESKIQSTNDKFEIISLGEIEITKTGDQTISVNPVRENWNAIELMCVELVK